MALWVASLNSGSNGNCYYIGNEHEAVLVDAGISCRDITRRMKLLGLNMQKVKAVFITHEHGDHVKGVEGLGTKYWLPHYFTEKTFAASPLKPERSLVRYFSGADQVRIGALTITAAPSLHDAVDPHSFTVSDNEVTVGVFTDMGIMSERENQLLTQCHAAFLEANYDDEMLAAGRYPESLKQRIRGNRGHLSNYQAAAIVKEQRPALLKHIFLSHLSKENNRPELALAAFEGILPGAKIHIAPRYGPSPVFHIHPDDMDDASHPAIAKQISLFSE